MRLATIALAVTAAGLTTTAIARDTAALSPAPPSGTGVTGADCFRTHDLRNHTIADRQTLLVDYNGRATYRITVRGACLAGASSSDPIVIREPPGNHIVCKPIDLDVSVAKGGVPSRCIVDSVVKMTPAEVAALPSRLRP
jgi:hypothetical protein